MRTNHSRNVTCHKPERCGLFPLAVNTISRSSKWFALHKVYRDQNVQRHQLLSR